MSVCTESEFFSIGMVIRDHTGMFMEGKTMNLKCLASVFAAEAVGVCEALSWNAEKGLTKVTVETDSLLTVQTLGKWELTESMSCYQKLLDFA